MPFKIGDIHAVERSLKEGLIAFLALPQRRLRPLTLGEIDVRTNPLDVPVALTDAPSSDAVNAPYRSIALNKSEIQFKGRLLANCPFNSLAVSGSELVNDFETPAGII